MFTPARRYRAVASLRAQGDKAVRIPYTLAAVLLLSACQSEPVTDGSAAPAAADTSPQAPDSQAPELTGATVEDFAAEQDRAHAAACAADETPIFACKFPDGKRVAVCGTKAGKAEYRFGGDTPELVLSGGKRAYTMYSGGGEGQIAFDNGDTRYIVFSRIIRTGFDERGNLPALSDGVVVERAGKFLAIKTCDDPRRLPFNHQAAETFLPEAKLPEYQFLFTDETIRADPPEDE
ncbi:MAG: hypothetical protein NWP98_01825 [Erythrobacter sp.]|nr:hypothetical protein [Erythrobacter sp.]